MTWKQIDRSEIVPIKQIKEFENVKEPVALYAERYSVQPDKYLARNAVRWTREGILEFEDKSSILILGSGHWFYPNTYKRLYEKNFKITAIDLVEEASKELDDGIKFIKGDFLEEDLGMFDYIFSTHTIEHFTRSQILTEILPKCWSITKKGFIFIVPYKDIGWGGEIRHKVELQEDDELAYHANKYKIIHDGKELCLWFKK